MRETMIDNDEKHCHSSQYFIIGFPFHDSSNFHAKVEKKTDTSKVFVIFVNFGFAEETQHSEKSKNIWFFTRFYVPLQP